MKAPRFHVATDEEIRRGETADIYFRRCLAVAEAAGLDASVVAEVRASSLPDGVPWAILAGIEEVAALIEGAPVDVWSMEEGSLFLPGEPVLRISGRWCEWAPLETPLLGLLCQASGIATRAARCKLAAGDRPVYSFGARRTHPAISPMVERSAYIGGCDGVATARAARLLGTTPVGTVPHAFVILAGDIVSAMKLFHEHADPGVPRVALVDTFCDERTEALSVASALGEALAAVRLDTPASRRGNLAEIVAELRWELDIRGFRHVKILASGGLDDEAIRNLPLADGFGVGTWISGAPVVNFALDVVQVEGKPAGKRGKTSGVKQVWRCPSCHTDYIRLAASDPPECRCGGVPEPLLSPLARGGEVCRRLPSPEAIRKRVLASLGAPPHPEEPRPPA